MSYDQLLIRTSQFDQDVLNALNPIVVVDIFAFIIRVRVVGSGQGLLIHDSVRYLKGKRFYVLWF